MAHILIVEDDQRAAGQIKARLGQAGHKCVIEPTGDAALEAAKRESPDMIILDVMLPGTSGFEVCRRVRRDPELYTVPILILSAMNDEEEVLHGLAQGADDYVVKPYNPSDLLHRVAALLRANAKTQDADDVTALPGIEAVRREIQRRTSTRETFAVAHCELLQLREFGGRYGADARNRAIRHLGRALSQCGAEVVKKDFFVGHMGGGHFINLLPLDETKTFCDQVISLWSGHIESLHQAAGVPPDHDMGPSAALNVIFCVTLREANDVITPKQLFEVLSQLRHKALETRRGGVHFDRRTLRLGSS